MKAIRFAIKCAIAVMLLFYLTRCGILVWSDTIQYATVGNHYALMAKSFNRLSIEVVLPNSSKLPKNQQDLLRVPDDTIPWQGKIYYIHPILPGILLVPLVKVFGPRLFFQWILTLLASIASYILISQLFRRLKVDPRFYKLFLVWFFFGSIYTITGMRVGSWALQHTIAITFLLAALATAYLDKKPFQTGVLITAAFLSRLTFGLYLPLLLWLILRSSHHKLLKTLIFCIPVVFGLGLLALYNYIRFGDPFQLGYQFVHSLVYPPDIWAKDGVQSWQIVPKNLIAFFFYPPVGSRFFASFIHSQSWLDHFMFVEPYPILFFSLVPIYFLIKSYKKNELFWLVILTIFLIFAVVISHFRLEGHYMIDTLPALVLLILTSLKKYPEIITVRGWQYLNLFSVAMVFYWFFVNYFYFY